MNRLSLWIALATLPIAVFAVYAVGFQWLALVGLLNVPPALATMLLLRTTVQWWLGQPWALQWGNRLILGGAAGFLAPLSFLLAWTVAREAGVLQANLYTASERHDFTTLSQPWRESTEPSVLPAAITVDAPPGAFAQGLWDALRVTWIGGDGARLHACVTTDYEGPTAPWPLFKSAQLECRFTIHLELHPKDPARPRRAAEMSMDMKVACSMYGFASQRHFRQWLGRKIGTRLRESIFAHAKKALPS